MLTHELIEKIDAFLEQATETNSFFSVVHKCSLPYFSITDRLRPLMENVPQVQSENENILKQARSTFETSIDFGNFIDSVRLLNQTLKDYFLDTPKGQLKTEMDIIQEIDSFHKFFLSSLIGNFDPNKFILVVFRGRYIFSALSEIKRSMLAVKSKLQYHIEPKEFKQLEDAGWERLQIKLETRLTFEEFTIKASALNRLYKAFCQVQQIPEEEFPLQIIKVETGSDWFDLMGNKEVITFIVLAIGTIARIYYSSYTIKGISKAEQEEVRAKIVADLELVQLFTEKKANLQSAGMTEQGAEEFIKGMFNEVASRGYDFVKGEPKVTLNNNIVLVEQIKPEDEFTAKLLARAQQKALNPAPTPAEDGDQEAEILERSMDLKSEDPI